MVRFTVPDFRYRLEVYTHPTRCLVLIPPCCLCKYLGLEIQALTATNFAVRYWENESKPLDWEIMDLTELETALSEIEAEAKPKDNVSTD